MIGDFPSQLSQYVYILPVNFINVCVLITSSLASPLNGLEKALERLLGDICLPCF